MRVCDALGAVLGAGILLGTRHVLTCAHALTLSDDPSTESDDPSTEDCAPSIEVIIDFVGLHPMRSARAWVAADGWVPPNNADGGDIALLELETAQPTGSTTPLRRIPMTWGRAVYTGGFPAGLENGFWLNAKLAGNGGPGIECVQMNPISPSGPVRPGFSGAPVFDEMTQQVIGMVVSKYADSEFGFSYMLPVEAIIRHLGRVREWVGGVMSSDLSLVEDIDSQALDNTFAREIVSWIERRHDADNTLIIVTGGPDSLRSATVRRIISLADREQRPHSADPRLVQAPEGTVPSAGSIHLAIDAAGKTPGEVLERIVDRTGIAADPSAEPTAELLDSPPPMTIVVYGIDDSQNPVMLVTDVLEPLTKRGHRLLLAFHQDLSPSLSIARSSLKTWMCAGLVPLPILDLPNPADQVLPSSTFPEFPRLTAGDLVANQYEVVGCLAHGGLGWVYLARDTHLDGNYVVLKRLINTDNEQAMTRERRFLTTADHPNIVRIFNFVTHQEPTSSEPTNYIVMEYVGGQSLQKIREIAKARQEPLGGPLQVEHVIAYGVEILDALEYLHSRGLLYCDMSPSNVIRSANRIKIIDLGAVRGIGDRWSPHIVNTDFQVGAEERNRGLTVQSDLYAVGKTLEYLFKASTDALQVDTETENSPIRFGIESFRRALERATQREADKRFPSAAAMSQQLRGVLREVLSLRDGTPRPEHSSVFTDMAALLDAGLSMVPPLDSWTTNHAVDATLNNGHPTAGAVAAGLPAPQPAAEDPGANFLATMSATDPRRLIEQSSMFQQESVEIQLSKCRAHLKLGEPEKAQACLFSAEGMPSKIDGYDWKIAWHDGLLALARDQITDAKTKFDEVYQALPGEDAPKLALGFCYEQDESEEAQRYYQAVWRRDRSQASAAFSLARICLRQGNRRDAVAILDDVPDVSLHYHAAKIATVRILSGRLTTDPGHGNGLPTVEDFREVIGRLPELNLDGGDADGPARHRLTTAVREVALDWVLETKGDKQLNGNDVLGNPVSEQKLRKLLYSSYHALARQAPDRKSHGFLVDLANRVRPWTLW
ncbi:MAG: protein kinase [Pseudonocardiales bacterium]|nr:protein kinase [Pseudonocardiales bacterium]